MEQRIIKLSVKNEYILGGGVVIGAAGSHDEVLLELDFRASPVWHGTTKKAVFYDALGTNPTTILLTTDKLVFGETEVYRISVPAEAKGQAGKCFLTIEGVVTNGETESVRVVTEAAQFDVLQSRRYEQTSDPNPVTPTQAEQLQAEIDAIKGDVVEAAESAAAAFKSEANAKVSESAAKSSEIEAKKSQQAAAKSETAAKASETAAAKSEANAKASETAAKSSETEAGKSAADAAASKSDAQAAKTGAANAAAAAAESQSAAAASKNAAKDSEDAAAASAQGASNSASAAAQSAADAVGAKKAAESWAVGGTGTREGENTNNAKYWAQQAEATVGGDFATKTEAEGYVADHNQSAAAHADIREAVSEAGKAFVITGTLASDELVGYTVSGVTATEAEIQAAIAAGKEVKARLTYTDEIYELPLVYHDQSWYQFGGNLGNLNLIFDISYTESGIESRYSEFDSVSLDDFELLSDKVDNQRQTLLTHVNDANIHVTAEEKTGWNAKAEKPKAVSVTLTAAGWDASTKKQTVTVPGVLADTSKQVIWVTQTTEAAIDAYLDAGIVPVAQAANAVTLRADTVPTADITVNIVVQEVQ